MISFNGYGGIYRGAGSDGDGVAELQTDVMRFMAMLGLCLVAIFALVRALPVTSAEVSSEGALEHPAAVRTEIEAEARQMQRAVDSPLAAAPVQEPEAPRADLVPEAPKMVLRRPATEPEVASASANTVRSQGAASRAAASITERSSSRATVVAARSSPPGPSQPEFSLRFASDEALLALVRRGQVELHAVGPDGIYALQEDAAVAGSAWRFARTPAPGAMHDLSASDVPTVVERAYLRSLGQSPREVRRWGVVLPVAMQQHIARALRDPRGGEIVISAQGSVTLEAQRPSDVRGGVSK